MADNLVQLKLELKKLIIYGVGDVLKRLGDIFNPGSKKYNELLIHRAAYELVMKDIRLEQLNHLNSNQQLINLTKKMLAFIEILEEEDILAPVPFQDLTYKSILIACKIPERKSFFEELFPKSYFKNVYCENSIEKLPTKNIDIIIYDDFPAHPDGKIDTVLKHYLENTEPVLLWYGIYSNLIKKYPEKAYSANSVFSLHSRLQEMINFLKYKEQAKIEKA